MEFSMRFLACLVLFTACSTGPVERQEDDLRSAPPPKATVVLVHGMGGFRNVAGVDYFWHVPALYQSLGAKVFVPGLSAFQSIEERAAQLAAQLDGVSGPLLIIAHSQGGLDARYLITRLGYSPRVKALVTIATPHFGSPVADVATGVVEGPVEDAVNALVGELGWSLEGANQLTTTYTSQVFNPQTPDMPEVTYWSYSGKAAPLGLGSGEGWLHAAFMPTWSFLKAEGITSDGIVPEASAHWGKFQGTLSADHLGEVDQPLGETPDFDAPSFYRTLLAKLAAQGW
jgi:triacylglycerol lipase